MGKLTKKDLINFLGTTAGEDALRIAAKEVSEQIKSAAKYYMGKPDGKMFTTAEFGDEVANAKKAYVTLNCLMGGETAEEDRFKEGKKQVPGLITPEGIKKIIDLFTLLYCFGENTPKFEYQTVRACRQTEVSEGRSIAGPLTSTTKLTIDEIMALGYGDKNGLAICKYNFHEWAVAFDMEELGDDYLKKEEREVLIMTGNVLESKAIGYDDQYKGRDGNPALMYEVDVYPPEWSGVQKESTEFLKKSVYDADMISKVQKFYEELNEGGDYPAEPEGYREWKENFQKLVFSELRKME